MPITHLDAHQHLHLWPSVCGVVLELAARLRDPGGAGAPVPVDDARRHRRHRPRPAPGPPGGGGRAAATPRTRWASSAPAASTPTGCPRCWPGWPPADQAVGRAHRPPGRGRRRRPGPLRVGLPVGGRAGRPGRARGPGARRPPRLHPRHLRRPRRTGPDRPGGQRPVGRGEPGPAPSCASTGDGAAGGAGPRAGAVGDLPPAGGGGRRPPAGPGPGGGLRPRPAGQLPGPGVRPSGRSTASTSTGPRSTPPGPRPRAPAGGTEFSAPPPGRAARRAVGRDRHRRRPLPAHRGPAAGAAAAPAPPPLAPGGVLVVKEMSPSPRWKAALEPGPGDAGRPRSWASPRGRAASRSSRPSSWPAGWPTTGWRPPTGPSTGATPTPTTCWWAGPGRREA